jgi:hypothetical protein
MKLSHGERSGLWAAFVGYVAALALWVVVRPTEDNRSVEFVLVGLGLVVAVVAFVAMERRLPMLRGRGPNISLPRLIFGFGAAIIWWMFVATLVPQGPDTSVYNEARSRIPTLVLFLSGWVIARMPSSPRPGSWRDRLSRRMDKVGHLLDEGSWDDPTSAAHPSRDIRER